MQAQLAHGGCPGAAASRPPAASGSRAPFPRPFGQYQLLEEIDRGGMGIVYRAEHQSLAAEVAIKVIRDEQWASREEVKRFHREARSAARMSHPGIVKVHDAGEREGVHFLVMEYVKGDSLRQRMRAGMTPQNIAWTLAQVAAAVQYLHEQGIVHRDLKPANILIDDAGRPKIIDFGLAKTTGDDTVQTQTGAIVGTPAYMAPEQAWSQRDEVSPRSDVYALGAILYEALTGNPPFQATNPLEMLLKVRDAEPPQPRSIRPTIPLDLEQICMRCLEKRPEDRYSNASELAADLEASLRGEPISVVPRAWAERTVRWAKRHPALCVHWAGIAAAFVIAQGRHWTGHTRPHVTGVSAVLLGWMLASGYWQRRLLRSPLSSAPRVMWLLTDAGLFTWALWLAERPLEPLLTGYGLLIVASGLWLRVQYILAMTVASIVGALALSTFAGDPHTPGHYPLIVSAILAVTGGATAYQAFRLTLLGRFLNQNEPRG